VATATPTSPTLSVALDMATIDTLTAAVAERVAELLPDPAEDRWLTTVEAADYLSLPVSSIRKLTAAEGIPFTQDCDGGRCYFLRSQLDRWRLEGAHGPWN